ncbi:hypothetical protein [Maribacter cobaltidurans]|nr:hypothetical protein [Maribacter cobaltidurans]
MSGYFSQKNVRHPEGLDLEQAVDVATFAHGLVLVASADRKIK